VTAPSDADLRALCDAAPSRRAWRLDLDDGEYTGKVWGCDEGSDYVVADYVPEADARLMVAMYAALPELLDRVAAAGKRAEEAEIALRGMRVGREWDDLAWRKKWEQAVHSRDTAAVRASWERRIAAAVRHARAERDAAEAKLAVAVAGIRDLCRVALHLAPAAHAEDLRSVAREALAAIEGDNT